MVTNLTEEAKAIWAKAIRAKDPEEKLRLLQLFYSKMPHHKGTEKLEVSIKRQIAALKEEIIESKKKKAVRKDLWIVKKQGVMAVLVDYDFTDSFYRLTGVNPSQYEVFSRPFVAPLKALDIIIQTYYAPIGVGNLKNFMKLIKQADVLIIADERVVPLLESEDIVLVQNRRRAVEILRMPTGGIRIIGKSRFISEEKLRSFLTDYGILNCVIKISEDATMDDVEDYIFGKMQKVFVNMKSDPKELVSDILKALGLIRIYTLDSEGAIVGPPLLVRVGSTVGDVAREINIKNAKGAYIVRNGSKMRVGVSFELEEGDQIRILY
ncbi:MAG: TGS domain-containing protein [Nitrososphaeria archaeon]